MNIEKLYSIYLEHPTICTDTRLIEEGCLFFALKGDNFNGNKFAHQALQKGAAYAIIDEEEYCQSARHILVSDVLETLQNLAKHRRSQLKIPFIGITGTNGKTTTKELINAVLSQHYKTFATKGNLNNHIGVPLTILSIQADTEIAIIEMGANHQQEIEFLCSISQPTHGLITNVGKAHLEGFGSFDGVKKAKGELYTYLAEHQGIAFINQDNKILTEMANARLIKNTIDYGRSETSYVSGKILNSAPYISIKWSSRSEEFENNGLEANSNLTGTYNFENILAAITIGCFFRLSPDEINKGVHSYLPSNNRSQITKTEQNTLICDYYNANPSSVQVALDNLETVNAENKVLILGDMFELGDEAAAEHLEIVAKAQRIDLSKRIFIGQEFYKLKNTSDHFYPSTTEAFDALKNNPITNATILIKGSRGMKLETLVPLL
ncbi:MAG: UDP-N-acetylmuramoylalanyl-D-glutamyl-2,6-diaminopimelate/D-alanyl-D-alanyl ligase [Sphingobacteriales bacterium]|nr:UDP-N-acetylmuramoylalanyl-D-glutamyl-2,6-diaminopimelate/D-alanyl-D-alanyl ligase [Sphingobacteriales bacterium]